MMWEDSDPVEEDLRAGRLGAYGPFEGWPEEAYKNHPMYVMMLTLSSPARAAWLTAEDVV